MQIEDFFQGVLIVEEQICEFIKKKKTALKIGLLYFGIKSIKIMRRIYKIELKCYMMIKISKFC